MTRTLDHARRDQLAAAAADFFVANGNLQASLRELASDVGASARMLVHHFGDRQNLVDAALEIARARQIEAARAAIVPGPDALAVLGEAWRWFRRKDTRRYFVLFSNVAAKERAAPAGERRFTRRLGSDWRPLFEAVFRADPRFTRDAPTLALLVVSALRGFSLDLNDGADAAHHKRAFGALIELIAAAGEPRR